MAAVEVSVDNGVSWNSAAGRDTWSYNFIAGAAGTSVTVLSRAVDDSGNIGVASAGITLNVTDARLSVFDLERHPYPRQRWQ